MGKSIWNNYSNDDLLKILKDFAEKLNRTPKKIDMKSENNVPSVPTYLKRFKTGKWNDILEMCKLDYNWIGKINEDAKEQHDKILNDSVIEITRIAKELQRLPTYKEYESYKTKGYSTSRLEFYTGMTFNAYTQELVQEYKPLRNCNFNKEDIINCIYRLKDKLNRTPYFREVYNELNYCDHKSFKKLFGKNYNQFVKEDLQLEVALDNSIKTDEELLDSYYNLFKNLKRIPYLKEIENDRFCASCDTYLRRFGSIGNVCELLGIDYNLYYKNINRGYCLLDLNGEICRSIVEMDITNFFIVNKIKYIKEPKYSDVILSENNRKSSRRFDWKIYLDDSYELYIEFLGLYKHNTMSKDKYNIKTKNKIKTLYKNGYIDKCMFIFPHNIKSQSIKDIFQPLFKKELINIPYTKSHEIQNTYRDLSDLEILNILMEHSDSDDYLPSTTIMPKNGLLCYYNEILRRYGTYNNFAKQMNKLTPSKTNGYWSDELIFCKFKSMLLKYGQLISINTFYKNKAQYHKDGFCAGMYKKGGIVDTKLWFYSKYVLESDYHIPKNEIEWLQHVANDVISARSNHKYSKTQVEQAISILSENNKQLYAHKSKICV